MSTDYRHKATGRHIWLSCYLCSNGKIGGLCSVFIDNVVDNIHNYYSYQFPPSQFTSTISIRNAWFQASRHEVGENCTLLKSKCVRIVASRLGYWLVAYMDTNVVPPSHPCSHRLWQYTASSESKGDTNPVLFVVSNAPVSFAIPVPYVSVAAGDCAMEL